MQDRRRDGIAWLTRDTPAWSEGSFFAIHNWWHLTLFRLGLDQTDEVMALLDQRVLGSASPVVLDLVDASALLWRLQLRGVNVGDRWNAVAARWAAVSAVSTYAFNDLHAMMAFVGAGRDADAEAAFGDAERHYAQSGYTRGMWHAQVLLDLAHFLADRGRAAEAQERLDQAVALFTPQVGERAERIAKLRERIAAARAQPA
jgi:hypothetical protein